jgi:HEXXH motif-containing protein
VSPALFGTYIELCLALFEERHVEADLLVEELLHWGSGTTGALRVLTLSDEDLGEGQAARYRRLLSEDIGGDIRPLRAEERVVAEAELRRALDLLEAGAPDFIREMRPLIRQIVLVEPATGSAASGLSFEGASTFSLWGAIVMNADEFGGRLDIAMTLVHEAAHNLLFGLALGGRLTENDEADRFASPLRPDLRPMEGVAHATYVTARMISLLETLVGSGSLTTDEVASAREKLTRNERSYQQGLATLDAHASFTSSGSAVFSQLRRFMDRRQAALTS